ncbi:MAG: chorismate mutase [Spirochaetales bacterium]|jgi:chorismate mutase|nr:chorismate mutase [Sphaerochaetaceae bacterium]NLV84941.1 chorismate mutase [Spirochaetales bacterium]
MNERLFAVRGAVQVMSDEPSRIVDAVARLYESILHANEFIHEKEIVDIMFTVTDDLRSINPATALRKNRSSFSIPLFCMQEPNIDGMSKNMIRILIHAYGPIDTVVRPQYLDGAASLRPDLTFRS